MSCPRSIEFSDSASSSARGRIGGLLIEEGREQDGDGARPPARRKAAGVWSSLTGDVDAGARSTFELLSQGASGRMPYAIDAASY